MKLKSILTLLLVVVFSMTLIAMPASAAPAGAPVEAVFSVENVTANVGTDVDVAIKATGNLGMFGFKITYNPELLTFKSISYANGTTAVDNENLPEGTIAIERADTSLFVADGTVVATVTFTVCSEDALNGAISTTTEVGAVVLTDADDADNYPEPYVYNELGACYGNAEGLAYTDGSGVVTIVTSHTAPVVTAVITGSGKVGEELSAATSTVVDPWELEPTAVTYSWVIDGKTVSTTNAYTPGVDDLGKLITLTVTATVDAEDEPTGTGTDTVKIVGVVAPASVKAGKDIDVSYAFADEGDVVATAKYAEDPEANEEDWTKISDENITVADDKVTVATDKSLAGNYVVVTIKPFEGEAFVTAPIEVKKASSTGRSTGNAPSLVNKTTDPGTTEVDPGTTDGTKIYPKDSIYLTIGSKEVIVFGEVVMSDVAPQIVNERTMLPARIVAENLGAEVAWDEEARTVTITKGETVIVITIDSDKALVNGEEFELDSPAFIEDSRTFTPMRFIAETLGATVGWDDATKTVKITPAVVAAE